LDDLSTLVGDIPVLVSDCKISETEHHLDLYNTQPGNFSYCIADIEALFETAQQLVADVKAEDFTSLINDAITFYNDIK